MVAVYVRFGKVRFAISLWLLLLIGKVRFTILDAVFITNEF